MHMVYSGLPAAVQQYDVVNNWESPNKLCYLQLTPVIQTFYWLPWYGQYNGLTEENKREEYVGFFAFI